MGSVWRHLVLIWGSGGEALIFGSSQEENESRLVWRFWGLCMGSPTRPLLASHHELVALEWRSCAISYTISLEYGP